LKINYFTPEAGRGAVVGECIEIPVGQQA